ncbi:glutaredoxin domain-containing protein [Wolbachia endosymbiont of Ctenocephalides felis wCfeT]|uniref:glutaredoxin domain-containing protein n=1 Tax=Wolbachia endosymbiont of Ctenocephalides felis wCfeT TaxID=2732593 RepID=UPI0014465933|nr:glutaredoxin domain-containing protein [Wolbachia endosymbiont of Ctenocephalides felis wCfeT]
MKNYSKKVVIYTKQGCPHCRNAKILLDKKGVKYEEIDAGAEKNKESFESIKSKYNVKTVPQIFIADEKGKYIYHIKGNDALQELNNDGKLDGMLKYWGLVSILNDNSDHVLDASNEFQEECAPYHDDLI